MAASGGQFSHPLGISGHQFPADYKGHDRMNGKNLGGSPLLLLSSEEVRVNLRFELLVWYFLLMS